MLDLTLLEPIFGRPEGIVGTELFSYDVETRSKNKRAPNIDADNYRLYAGATAIALELIPTDTLVSGPPASSAANG